MINDHPAAFVLSGFTLGLQRKFLPFPPAKLEECFDLIALHSICQAFLAGCASGREPVLGGRPALLVSRDPTPTPPAPLRCARPPAGGSNVPGQGPGPLPGRGSSGGTVPQNPQGFTHSACSRATHSAPRFAAEK